MNIELKFKELEEKKEKALVAYVAGGDPNYETSKEIIKAIAKHADIIEIGIPFSDPVADGPTIQKAAQRALKEGFSLKKGIQLVKDLRSEGVENPLLFMSYYNPIYTYGLEDICKEASEAGLNGFIIPDLPPDEADEILEFTKPNSLDMVFLLAPTMTENRIKMVTENSSGFVYLVSVAGITGARASVNNDIESLVDRIKDKTTLPVGVGFGISNKDQVKEICQFSDAVIVGSAIVKQIENNLGNNTKIIEEIEKFVEELKQGTK